MLLSVKLNNCFIYNKEVSFTMRADMRYKRLSSNVIKLNNVNVLKSAVILGPNNTGKTNFIRCIAAIRDILLNKGVHIQKCFYDDNNICSFEIEFLDSDTQYLYRIKYDDQKKQFVFEELLKFEFDKNKNKKEIRLWLRDIEKQVFDSNDDDFNTAMKSASTNNIVIHLLDNSKFDILSIGGTAITTFANKIDIVDMNNLPIQKTIQFLKSSDRYRERIASFVKNADLYMDDFRYLSDNELSLTFTSDELNGSPQENVLTVPNQLIEMFHLASYYKGKIVPSIIYDSTGTKKMAALASYIIDALENGKTLIIDEIDNSLHFKLTRAIISIFNNELNQKAQLICTAHDVSLLDNKKLLRKEQIWFTHKDASQVYLYSLSEYTAEKDGIRDTTDLLEKYKKGVFGAIPEPDLFSTLMEVSNNE